MTKHVHITDAPPRVLQPDGRPVPPHVRERYENEFLRLWEARDAITDELQRYADALDAIDALVDAGGAHG